MYGVKFVRDDQLPNEYDWALAREHGGRTYLFIKESKVDAQTLERAWRGFRLLAGIPDGPLQVPEQRRGVDLRKPISLVKATG